MTDAIVSLASTPQNQPYLSILLNIFVLVLFLVRGDLSSRVGVSISKLILGGTLLASATPPTTVAPQQLEPSSSRRYFSAAAD